VNPPTDPPPAADSPIILIKLGGSLLTDKRQPETARHDHIERLAGELAAARRETGRQVILGHGSGSFGHAAAERFRIGEGFDGEGQCHGAATTQDSAARLNRLLVAALLAAGESPYVLAPSSFLLARLGRPVKGTPAALKMALGRGFLPVVFGDLLLDSELGVSIASTETVLIYLASRLLKQGIAVSHAYWLGDTDGVFDEQGELLATLHPEQLGKLRPALGGARGFDVTGGMLHRVESAVRLAELGVTNWIANGQTPGLLARALRGEPVPGTCVTASD
jgi:isopentenyl phosphate kinase